MHIIFKMTMDDYLELLRLKNDDISSLKKAKFRYKISIAFLIVALTFFLLRIVSPFYIPVLVVASILLIIWFSYSDSIVDRGREKTIIDLVNREFSKSIKQVRETKITLQEDGIIEEIEGMYSKIQWNFIDDIIVTENNIFINLEFESLDADIKNEIIKQVTVECKRFVIGALYDDFDGIIYSFNLKEDLTMKMNKKIF